MPKVSVIVPNYNHAAYLQQRLDSVLEQTYPDFEVIVLDDRSTDNSKEIIEQYRNNKKISEIIYNETNTGNPFKQWDKGIQLSKGDYIWIAESDDWCELNLLETIMGGLEKNEACVLGYCQGFCVTDEGEIKFQSIHTRLAEYIDGKQFVKEYLLVKNPIFNAGMAVWKKSAYKTMSKEYLNYKLIGDYCFWIELCLCGPVFISGKMLNYFRAHEKNISFNSLKKGSSFSEQIPLFKSLMDKNIISRTDYMVAVKRSYYLFRSSLKNLSRENVKPIKDLFALFAGPVYKLKIYFFQKTIQNRFRKLLKL